jgi:ABC-type multidrug transport system ATPase subunit
MSVKIDGLTKSFGKKTLFTDFSFTFADTGIYVIRGESGAGKTTLLRIIAGLDKEYTGRIERSAPGVSVCFQEYRLFDSVTAVKNVTEAAFDKATEDEVAGVCALFKRLNFSDDDILLYPRELSGGMKQRVAFIRAVAKDAPILILDEPTKEIDPENAAIMRKIIKEESKKRLVIMVTHKTEDISDLQAQIIDIGAR